MTMPKAVPGDARAKVEPFLAVFERDEFRWALEFLARERWGWGMPEEVRPEPLKAHRRRCTFDVQVRTASGWHGVIGKAHLVDRGDVFQTMEAVQKAGFGPEAEFSIPTPLLYLPSLHLLLEEEVAGVPAMATFLEGPVERHAPVAGACARWLARFHDAGPLLSAPADPADHLVDMPRWAERVSLQGEALAAKTAELVRRIQAGVPQPGSVDYRAGHGSFIPEHVLLGERVCTIDLDECDVADPARDVAWFVVSLQRLALRQHGRLDALDAPMERFLSTYADGRPGAVAHVPFYRALECLHRAHRDVAKRVPARPEWSELMLDEGLRVLA